MMRLSDPRRLAVVAVLAVLASAVSPAAALAATGHPMLVSGSIFGGIAHALLGAFSWTVDLASKFVLVTLGALVRMLIPRSWAQDGAQIMAWIVAVPDYAGRISTPGRGSSYGFAGVNSLRVLFMWLGMAVAPLTLTHATARAMVDESEPVVIPVLRVLGVAAGILVYPYLWAQAANLADQITHVILALPSVTDGLQKLMDYAVDGVALGGWQLIDLGLMGAIGVALLGLIFMKVVIILLGALLYATGPLMIGLVPTRFGHAIARAWLSAVMFLLGIGIGWAALFAVGAVLIQDAGTAGPLLAGNSSFGNLLGGLILAVAGLAALWLCLKLSREAGGILRVQLGGMLALGSAGIGAGSRAAPVSASTRTTGASLRQFASRVSAAGAGAGGELAEHLPAGTRAALRGAAGVGRRGLIGTAAHHGRTVASRTAAPTAAILGRSRAGAVAVAMARRGTAAYSHGSQPAQVTHATGQGSAAAPGRSASGSRRGSRARARTGSASSRPVSSQSRSSATAGGSVTGATVSTRARQPMGGGRGGVGATVPPQPSTSSSASAATRGATSVRVSAGSASSIGNAAWSRRSGSPGSAPVPSRAGGSPAPPAAAGRAGSEARRVGESASAPEGARRPASSSEEPGEERRR